MFYPYNKATDIISNEVTKFMDLAPLMLPRLIDGKHCVDPDISEDSAILNFSLEESFPIGCVMDMLDENIDILMLYHGTSKSDPDIYHCCFFANPQFGKTMFSINIKTNKNSFFETLSVTVYDAIDIWEDDLENDLNIHAQAFDFIDAMTAERLLSVFCKMNYEG